MQTKTKFKKTPIGEIPEDWEVVRLIDHVNVLKGFAFSSKFFNDDGKGLPLIRIRDLGKNATEAYYSGPYDSEYLVNPGDILVSMDGEFNVFIWKGPRGLLNQRVAKIESKSPKLDQGYLYYALKKPLKIIEAQTSHTTVKHLLDKDIKRILIPLPPLPEQKKIAEILRTVDEAIEKTDEAIEKTERLKKGLMRRLLTKGLNLFNMHQKKLKQAIEKAFQNGDHLFGREENLVNHLTGYLREEFPDWDIDSEVEKDSRRRRPDIIIHKRGTPFNLFAIEIKKHETISGIKCDIEKLETLMMGEIYRYAEAVFIGFNIKNPEKILSLSKKVNFILVTEDGKIYIKTRERTFKKTELGEIPEEWRVVRLGEIAELKSGGTPSRKKPEYWENGTVPWVKSGELNDGVIYDTEEKITELAVKESSAKIFPKGTLLFALYGRGTVGKTAILGIDAATNQAVCGIFPKNNTFIPKFMQYYLIYKREQILTQYVNPSSDVGRTNIYISSLALLKIPLPSLSEQKRITEILMTVDKRLELLRKRKEKLERIKKGLMKDLLTGRRRVNV